MRIWKYTLAITDRQTVDMPAGSKLLTVQMQEEHPQLWALCEETNVLITREIAIYGTGNPIPDKPGQYVATFQSLGGALVWHVFELTA